MAMFPGTNGVAGFPKGIGTRPISQRTRWRLVGFELSGDTIGTIRARERVICILRRRSGACAAALHCNCGTGRRDSRGTRQEGGRIGLEAGVKTISCPPTAFAQLDDLCRIPAFIMRAAGIVVRDDSARTLVAKG
jgi:hypothetical protein